MKDQSSIPVNPEGTGKTFSYHDMLWARDKTWEAVNAIAAAIRPGMTEDQAARLADQWLADAGMERIWHGSKIRFGKNTLKSFRERSDPDVVLGDNDIFFVDLGPVWRGHEGDAGDTFVTGDDAQMQACRLAARRLFGEVRDLWLQERLSGAALYREAERLAREAGWRLNLDIQGHRVSDFPHGLYKAGALGAFDREPSSGLWVLEIQIHHPDRPFGAFYEDLLLA
ncbi:M24 family metallopeptidase [Paludibacterium paludis]|uniref:Peptidase M24 domain-containing protein n=1 Tax=Paludibacterium paludis TaxID=1225769 RepID=A0A918NXW2_9NEIS|nr:M24 family metallopeptidase [Paludibacterium paludis]GGY05143.1 hypothetical protein GCM10011289_04640 [Paludibacterium paludis]